MKILLEQSDELKENLNNIPSGVSIESASYIENSNFKNEENTSIYLTKMKKNIPQNYFLKIKVINQKKLLKQMIKSIKTQNNYLIKI